MTVFPLRPARIRIPFLGLLVLTLGWCAATAASDHWLRTRDGWVPAEVLCPAKVAYEPTLHPVTVTAWVALSSIWALLAFDRTDS